MAQHSHIMGGSTAGQRINCPGSYQLEQTMPKGKSSEFADEGSMLHAAMELIVIEDPRNITEAKPLFDQLIGQNMGYEGHEITAEHIKSKIKPATQAWLAVCKHYGIDDWFIEQRVSLEVVVEGAFGTADIIAKDKKNRLHVLDWKFGDGVPVPVEGNYGAGFYAAAALYDPDPELQDFTEGVTGVVLHIVQPRRNVEEDPLHTWETTVEWIESLIDQAAEANRKALQDDPPLKAGSWCRWCDAKPVCPQHQGMASEALSKAPDAMTSVDLAKYLGMADQLKPWIASIYELAQTEMERGAAVPGYKLVEKRAIRRWTDEAAVTHILKKGKRPRSAYMKEVILSPAQVEKNFPKVYSNTLSVMVSSKSSGVTVVPDTDKRPAVTSSVALLATALPGR